MILLAQKAQNAYKQTKIKRYHFYVHKKYLRGTKSLICLFAFCVLYAFCAFCDFCAFCAFAWLRLCAFYAFCACKLFS